MSEDPRYFKTTDTRGHVVYQPIEPSEPTPEATPGDWQDDLYGRDYNPTEPSDPVAPPQEPEPDPGDLRIPAELAEKLTTAIADNRQLRQRAGLDDLDPGALREYAADGLEGVERFVSEANEQTARLRESSAAMNADQAAAYSAVNSGGAGVGGGVGGGFGGLSEADRIMRALGQADAGAASLARAANLSRDQIMDAWVSELRRADPSAVQ